MFRNIYNNIKGGFSLPIFLVIIALILILPNRLVMAEDQVNQETGTYCAEGIDPVTLLPCTPGFDPSTITCLDSNGNNMMDPGECSSEDTSSPWFLNPDANNQKGVGVIPGGSAATLGQTAYMTIVEPHFVVKFFNAPSAPDTTYTFGVISTPSGNLREQHNEFGFEVIIDKKTDPLEPYYLKFYVPYSTVDSAQVSDTGEITLSPDCDGTVEACGIYSKEITEMDPSNPGVFNRYTITGTFTSTGTNYTTGSTCETGCTTDDESYWRADW